MPVALDCTQDTAESLRRGAAAAAARGLSRLAEILRQRAGEIEAAQPVARRAA